QSLLTHFAFCYWVKKKNSNWTQIAPTGSLAGRQVTWVETGRSP
ncbi:29096_t:CDS:1, partial [Racocetra persica]